MSIQILYKVLTARLCKNAVSDGQDRKNTEQCKMENVTNRESVYQANMLRAAKLVSCCGHSKIKCFVKSMDSIDSRLLINSVLLSLYEFNMDVLYLPYWQHHVTYNQC